MYLQKIPEKKTGRILLVFVEGYRKNGKVKQRTIEKIGYLDELQGDGPNQYPDPIAYFRQEGKRRTEQMRLASAAITLSIERNAKIGLHNGLRKNIGYLPLSKIYSQLGLDTFLSNRQRSYKIDYRLSRILKLLVFGRLLFPGSKRETWEKREQLFERGNFSLDDVYNSLSFFHRLADDIKLYLHEQIRLKYGRDTELMYYDVTNYYFEIEEGDRLRRKGVSKEHQPKPIVQMGLLMDQKGLPVTYELFSGNTNDCQTLMPVLDKVKEQYQFGRMIVVADRGLNSSNNTAMTVVHGDGYVYGQSIMKASKELKAFALEPKGYQMLGQPENGFRLKSRLANRTIHLESANGSRVETSLDEKQVFFYSDKYALRARALRQEALDKAAMLIASPSQYRQNICYGVAKYIKGLKYDRKTGEILDPAETLYLDEEVVAEEARYDGYYAIVSSELARPDEEIVNIYRGLWRIEDSFRVTKSELEARPVYVSREDHINAHFLTCFIALLLLRLVQKKTDYLFPAGQLLDAMRNMNGTLLQNSYYVFDYYSEAAAGLGSAFDIDFDRRLLSLKEILSMRK